MIHKVFNGGWHIRLYIENDLLRTLDTSMSGNFECVRTSNLAGISWWSNEYNLWCWRHNQHLLRMRSKRSNSMISASMVHARQVVTVTVITMIIIFMMLILSNSVRVYKQNYSKLNLNNYCVWIHIVITWNIEYKYTKTYETIIFSSQAVEYLFKKLYIGMPVPWKPFDPYWTWLNKEPKAMEFSAWCQLVWKIYNFWSYVRSPEISLIGTAIPIYIPLYTDIKSVMMTSWCSTSLTTARMISAKIPEKPSIFPMISTFYFQGFHFLLNSLELKRCWCHQRYRY